MDSTRNLYFILAVALKHFDGFITATKIKIGCIFHGHYAQVFLFVFLTKMKSYVITIFLKIQADT